MNNKNHPKQYMIIEACQRLSKPIRFPILSALLHLLRAGTIQRESSEMDLMATYCSLISGWLCEGPLVSQRVIVMYVQKLRKTTSSAVRKYFTSHYAKIKLLDQLAKRISGQMSDNRLNKVSWYHTGLGSD